MQGKRLALGRPTKAPPPGIPSALSVPLLSASPSILTPPPYSSLPGVPQVFHQMQATPGCTADAGTYASLIRILDAMCQYPQVLYRADTCRQTLEHAPLPCLARACWANWVLPLM